MSIAQLAADAALAAATAADNVSRLPPILYGAQVYLASELADYVDWGQKLLGIPEIHKQTMGERTKWAVIDTGRPDHPDCPPALFSHNFTESRTDRDENGHATHVAGTFGGRANGRGVLGYAPAAEVGYCKALGADGSGSNRGIALSIRAARKERVDGIIMSLGGAYDPMIEEECIAANEEGILLFCAGGNDGKQGNLNTVGYPGRFEFSITSGSFNQALQISVFSSRGEEIDVAMPGEDVMSCWLNGKFRRISGTSMSNPGTAGVAACFLSHQRRISGNSNLRITAAEIQARFARYSKDQGVVGRDRDWGVGIPDVARFVLDPISPTPPGDNGADVFALGSLRIRFPADVVAGKSGGIFWFE